MPLTADWQVRREGLSYSVKGQNGQLIEQRLRGEGVYFPYGFAYPFRMSGPEIRSRPSLSVSISRIAKYATLLCSIEEIILELTSDLLYQTVAFPHTNPIRND